MKKSKVLSVVASATLVASMLLTACGDNSNNSSTPGSSTPGSSTPASTGGDTGNVPEDTGWRVGDLLPALSAAEQGQPGELTVPRSSYVQYPIADAQGITLTFWLEVPGNVQKWGDETANSVQLTEWAKRWQELTGVTIEFQGPTTKADEEFGKLSANTKYPDIVEWGWTQSYTGGPAQAYEDGMLIWLDDYITPTGPAADVWQYLQDNPTLDTAVKTDDGHYYCFPFTRGSKLLGTTSGPIVRNDLLAKIGKTTADMVTIDDWTEIMTALKANGVAHPISFESPSYMINLLQGAYSFRTGMFVSAADGKIHYGEMEEGYRDMLKQVREWIAADLVTDSTEWNGGNTKADIMNGDSAIAYGALGSRLGSWNTAAWAEPDTYGADFELVGAQFAVLKEGQKIQYSGGSLDYATGSHVHAAITADCKYPEIAAAFLNFCYTEAGHKEINFGQDGVAYNGFVETEYGPACNYSDIIMQAPDIAVAMAHYGRANMSGTFIQDPRYILGYYATDQQKAAVTLWAQNDVVGTFVPAITLTPEESNEYSTLATDINKTITEYRGKALTGDANFEADWDAYVALLKSQGIERMIELQQQALDRYNAR